MILPSNDRPEQRMLVLNGSRRRLTLARAVWQALEEIARREDESIPALLSRIDGQRGLRSLKVAAEAFAALYFWQLATQGPGPRLH